jgi:hypothetical protein
MIATLCHARYASHAAAPLAPSATPGATDHRLMDRNFRAMAGVHVAALVESAAPIETTAAVPEETRR